ncbi:4a-hydroxytetrahydrobiopterin dehydratase [Nocardioides humilatus]|uniref:Putative pterin-4-alpha-carbinolamine dehydratase n=1 Tax=Nocardioides humilatus TaxID=2607660 RepID=A0A5B1L4T7_9ACTN|nr:4a-hydroxytetrahydrobiopterin dehydratase [Nocardioides humilatus]KAA1415456.1 4a-hydroxytetrahydrobiopterin dehydratase [Nocardioides humilatus]
MVTSITAEQFAAAEGVQDWTILGSGEVGATFKTGSFARGVDLIARIGALADAANHHPDVDLRYPSVAVRLSTHEIGGLSERDVALAREISAAAAELGIETG